MKILRTLTLPMFNDGVATSFDLDLLSLSDASWDQPNLERTPSGAFGNVYVKQGGSTIWSSSVSVSGHILSVTLASAPNASDVWVLTAQIQYETK